MMKSIQVTFFMALIIAAFSCQEEEISVIDLSEAGHPRILLLEGEEEQILNLVESDEVLRKIHVTILQESNSFLGRPVLERKMIGRRLLSTSRELLKRVFFLSYAYRMTGEDRFLKKAEDEILAVCGFSDWNPSHFLDVAEMTLGVAIGYDWLYAGLSEDTRKKAKRAILNKGINPSKMNSNNYWLGSDNNWNQVCNAGMVFGALAIQEDYPDLATEIIDRAFESIAIPMEAYGPDGAYPEGYGYWGYGTTFNVLFLSAIEKVFGDDRGLTKIPGFLETGQFMKHMVTPSGKNFSWGDNSTSASLKPAMLWFADNTEEQSLLWSEKLFFENESRYKNIHYLPAAVIWAKDISLTNIIEPSEKFWVGQGKNPVAIMRSEWDDEALYLGFKAGSPSVNHGHMDIGSFVLESDGVRWAADLGNQNYESLESLGIKVFGKGQDAQRWSIFRMGTYSHNVLIVDDQQQRVSGYAKIDKQSNAKDFMFAVSDISTVYEGQLKEFNRGVGIIEGNYMIVRDEFETLDKTTTIRWNMVTSAAVDLGENEAILTDSGKRLFLKVNGPNNVEMKTWSTVPTNNYDAENPGTIMVGFECEIPSNTKESFEVILVPEAKLNEATFLSESLTDW